MGSERDSRIVSRDDKEIPFAQLASYRHKLTMANFHEIESGGHQLGSNINLVAKDIKIRWAELISN